MECSYFTKPLSPVHESYHQPCEDELTGSLELEPVYFLCGGCLVAVVLLLFMAVALGLLTAVMFPIGCCLCTTLPTERLDFPPRLFIAWTLPTLLEYQVRMLVPSGIASKLTLHMASLGGGAFFAALAQARPQYGCGWANKQRSLPHVWRHSNYTPRTYI